MTEPNTNYLNKKDMLTFIHHSKASYSWYIDTDKYKDSDYLYYDLIVCGQDMYDEARSQLMLQIINTRRRETLQSRTSVLRDDDLYLITDEDYEFINSKILEFSGTFTDKLIELAKLGRYNRECYAAGRNRVRELPEDVDYPKEDLVIRVFTYEHIPKLTEETGSEKKIAHYHERVQFPPYLHYSYYNGKFQVVTKSHHVNENTFSISSGNISRELGEVYLLQTRRVSYKHNTKGYSYIDDMVSHANVQLVRVGLQFNELFSDNPFAYFTTIITNSFKTILKEEKRSREHRDRMLIEAGFNPSFTEQIRQEDSRQEYWNGVLSDDDDNNMELSQDSNWDEDYSSDNTSREYDDSFYQNNTEDTDMDLEDLDTINGIGDSIEEDIY